jgi:phospholipase/lecithinase/hemolysin
MSWTTHLSRGAAALCLSLTALGAQGATAYSNIYVFGDSLSDSGNDLLLTKGVPSPLFYSDDNNNQGRFTNGLNYVDRLAANFGLSLAPSVAGGTNYAHGGARTDSIWDGLRALGGLDFNAQIGAYLDNLKVSGAAGDPNALYVLWIGSNDMADAFAGDPNAVPGAIQDTVLDIAGALGALQTAGARNFLIGNLPDLSLTPLGRGSAVFNSKGDPQVEADILQGLHQGSALFNAALSGYLPFFTLPSSTVTLFDAFSLQTAMTTDPTAYGLTNVTAPCYDGEVDGSPALGKTTARECPNENEYLYYDMLHPTTTLHDWAARTIYAQLVPEPAGWALTLTALGLMGFMGRRRARS